MSVLFSVKFLRTRSIVPCLRLHSAIDFGSAKLLFNPLKEVYAPALAAWAGVLCLVAIPAFRALARAGKETGSMD